MRTHLTIPLRGLRIARATWRSLRRYLLNIFDSFDVSVVRTTRHAGERAPINARDTKDLYIDNICEHSFLFN